MARRERMKITEIGKSAAKPRTGERSTTIAQASRNTSDRYSEMVDYLLNINREYKTTKTDVLSILLSIIGI